MTHNKSKTENGSYTIEASISLIVFVIAIMFVYSQIKTMLCENIMQHAVDNMAAEMSTYVYVLDRAGLIIDDENDRLKDLDSAIGSGETAYTDSKNFITNNLDTFTDIYSSLEGGDIKGAVNTTINNKDEFQGNAKSMVDSIKNFVAAIKKVDWKKTAQEGVRVGGAEALKAFSNGVLLSNFYNWKLDAYLPTDRETFCKRYLIDSDSINFNYSRIFPTAENNNIVVAVTYETQPAFKMFPVKRKIVKVACTAAWVKNNQNELTK